VNATDLARQAYSSAHSPLRTNRSAEQQVLAMATANLRAAADASPPDFARLARALHLNRQLWTRLAADVADTGNPLPEELRARVFYLAEFTAAHTGRVLRGRASVEALIEINLAVMRGLSDQAVTPEQVRPS
jgi:flagellar protein FlaF